MPVTYNLVLREPVTCRDCVLYGRNTGYCFMLGIRIENPDDPPCRHGKSTSSESL